MIKKFKCIIVEDEPIIAHGIKEFAKKIENLDIIEVFHNGIDALNFATKNKIDICFVDIHIPGLSGIDFISAINDLPIKIIIITSYPEYAVKGFELNVIDYLIKPFSFERFENSIRKVIKFQHEDHESTITIKGNYGLEKIKLLDINFIEAMHNYMIIHVIDRKILTYSSLQKLENNLPKNLFLRCHKSFIINLNKVTRISGYEIYIQDVKIPIGRTFKKSIDKAIFAKNKII